MACSLNLGGTFTYLYILVPTTKFFTTLEAVRVFVSNQENGDCMHFVVRHEGREKIILFHWK